MKEGKLSSGITVSLRMAESYEEGKKKISCPGPGFELSTPILKSFHQFKWCEAITSHLLTEYCLNKQFN
jgi:hypothetical protein